MRSARRIVVLLLFVSLGSCAYPSTEARWEKPEAGEAEREQAHEQCMKQAEELDVRNFRDRMQAEARANAYVACMEELGWKRVAVEQAD